MLVIAVGQQGSVLGAVGTGVAKLVTEKMGRPMRVRVTSGMDAIVGAGDAELGVSASDSAHLSSNGLRHYEGRPQTRLPSRPSRPAARARLHRALRSAAANARRSERSVGSVYLGTTSLWRWPDFSSSATSSSWYPKIAYAITFPTPARVGISMTEILAIAAVVGLIVGSAAFTGLGFTLSLPASAARRGQPFLVSRGGCAHQHRARDGPSRHCNLLHASRAHRGRARGVRDPPDRSALLHLLFRDFSFIIPPGASPRSPQRASRAPDPCGRRGRRSGLASSPSSCRLSS